MKIKLFSIFIFLCCSYFSFAQVIQSPSNFLGYELGKKFTAHHIIVDYFKATAAAIPQQMLLEKYGETNEDRPLLIAIISSAKNIANIEEIRKNNLRLTGLLKDKEANINAPAIVWLSYNVHGNETSSSEAAMKVLYELVLAKNPSITEWLNNTVVIIDPCLNPDGRERYVNWFTQVSGKTTNVDRVAREHSEPWPGGRTNHYNFDLNRDWAWQTQKESQERLAKYQTWMPQIHSDYHEQGINNPYYFAPAAEPVHTAVTQWQKDFQVTVGKNNAKYFDANGWLFFTKEIFDLFYPSYGDTYPLFNGAIGMTFEQAGGPRGGSAVLIDDGDTLTLTDRIEHHFTTSLSTIEATSKNATAVISNFKKYFDAANAGINNPFKTYIVSNNNTAKADALLNLLRKNNIRYGFANSNTSIKAYNYFSDKEEQITVQKNDIVIASAQPKGTLLSVLFEKEPLLKDSATYDITAWALPYTFGIQAYATNAIVTAQIKNLAGNYISVDKNAYGYILHYNSLKNANLLSTLLQQNVKIKFNQTPFSFNKTNFAPGSLIILKKGNENKIDEVLNLAAQSNITVTTINSGFVDSGLDFGSEKVVNLKNPTVAMLTGDGASSYGAGEVWHLFEQELNKPITLINVNDFGINNLKNYNTLVIPDGYYKFLANKDAAADIKQWVKDGGKLIVMENAAKQIGELDWGLKLKKLPEDKTDTALGYIGIKTYADRERESVQNNVPGAIYKTQLDNTHPLAYGYDNFYYTLKMNENVFGFVKEGWNVATIKKQKPTAGFVGNNIKKLINDGTLIGELPMGRGTVIFFADDPIFRSFWENGKLMFCNAVFFAGQ